MTNSTQLPKNISESVRIALDEDIGNGDITANLIPEKTRINAHVICRENAVICGIPWFNAVFEQLGKNVTIEWLINDGEKVKPDQELCRLQGSARSILSGERCALNFLQTLSATATLTNKFVSKITHTQTQILDTRKTIPGLRDAQKYAVLCGGGKNHRKGLYDGILIKENHISAAGSIQNAVNQARLQNKDMPIEVEVETLGELKQALNAKADIMLLDNMDKQMLKQAVAINQHQAKLEASGNVSLETIVGIAETGVDFISIGTLTKNIHAIDLSMRVDSSINPE